MEARVEEAFRAFPGPTAKNALETMEHLAILKRWYYRGTRAGEIFFADSKGELPMRRIVRGISSDFRSQKVGCVRMMKSSRARTADWRPMKACQGMTDILTI